MEKELLEKIEKALEALQSRHQELSTKLTALEKNGQGNHAEEIKALQGNVNELKGAIDELKRQRLHARTAPVLRRAGTVSDECAREIAAQFILHCERSGKMEALCSLGGERDSLLNAARNALGMTVKAAVTTAEIPLPVQYGGEIRELISEFGVVRKAMTPYPIGMGTAKPARMGTRPAFGSIAMSGAFGELVPTVTFASLESHKIGGIVRLPREIDEQSIVAMGRYLVNYGVVEFARAEDTWGFLADGTGTYENVKGIVQVAKDNAKTLVLGAGKTHASDATLADFRTLRTKVNKAALNGRIGKYYLDSTWEVQLPGFRTAGEQFCYQRLPDGSALLDGYPIVWTDVLTPYGTGVTITVPLAVFGALSFWWMGEHGSPRIDTSEHVYFANDQLATRFIEEIDFDYAAVDAAAVMLTAAA